MNPDTLPFGPAPRVHVCIRDHENGREDRLYAVNINDREGDTVIRLQTDDVDEGTPVSLQSSGSGRDDGVRWLNLPHCSVRLRQYRCYVGNILWDAGIASRSDAIRLVRALLAERWHVEEVVVPRPSSPSAVTTTRRSWRARTRSCARWLR
mgnify:CR=1 FL=1